MPRGSNFSGGKKSPGISRTRSRFAPSRTFRGDHDGFRAALLEVNTDARRTTRAVARKLVVIIDMNRTVLINAGCQVQPFCYRICFQLLYSLPTLLFTSPFYFTTLKRLISRPRGPRALPATFSVYSPCNINEPEFLTSATG